ncbi:hypothetical protein B0H14DRAFT_3528161 [Mycena olivaceomarginata]|nr:hypothetical protein B0H14DRAFT_3528161 [Mycena olivaceomarginata]
MLIATEIEAFLKYSDDMVQCHNLRSHLNTPTHLGAYDTEIERAHIAEEDLSRLSHAYNTFGAPELPRVDPSGPSQVPQMFPQPEDDMDIDFDLPQAPINVVHLINELGELYQPEVLGPEETCLLLQQEFKQMLKDAYQETHDIPGVEDQFIADELPKCGEDEDHEDTHCFDAELLETEEYFPYPNKTAEQWTEYYPSQLTPIRFVIPRTWIIQNGELTTDILFVTRAADGRWVLEQDAEDTFQATELTLDFDNIHAEFGDNLLWVDETSVPVMPNSMRDLVSDDEDLFGIMVSLWADDVSGNRSKQYNKHMNMCTGNGCLPGQLLQQEFHIHYISTSPPHAVRSPSVLRTARCLMAPANHLHK